jgi:chromosomal replication initiator protein
MHTLWSRTLEELKDELPSREFAVWIECLRLSEGDDTLTVEAPSAFHRNWVQRHFLERIRSTVASVAGRPVPVVVAIGVPVAAAPSPPPLPDLRPPDPTQTTGAHALTFDSFVVGPCNALAHAAATAVGRAPGRQYNPLFIHGGVGLGKTHLLHATANVIRIAFPRARVLAIGAELFVNDMVSALRRQQMGAFHQRYRRADALIVDDVQFIAGKERTQEEFLHAFNLLCAAGKQIVVSSDKPPREIAQLEDGLRSRFEGGMIAEVSIPDRETRRRILERKAAAAGLPLDAAVLSFLAERVRAVSVRELEGVVTRLRAVAALERRPIDATLAEAVVGTLYPDVRARVSVERVESVVAAEVGVGVDLVRSPSRGGRVVLARQIAMYLMRKLLGLSFAVIGERYGRDHTTVLHAVRVIESRRACDPEVRRLVNAAEDRL